MIRFTLFSLTLLLVPAVSVAQRNIERAIEKLRNTNGISICETITSKPDEYGIMTKNEVYNFSLPEDERSLIADMVKAFEKDKGSSYSVYVKKNTNNMQAPTTIISFGQIILGKYANGSYYVLCFNDASDSTGSYRHAYAIEWYENKVKDKKMIEGLVLHTYGMKPSLKSKLSGISENSSGNNGSSYFTSSFSEWAKKWQSMSQQSSPISLLNQVRSFCNQIEKHAEGHKSSSTSYYIAVSLYENVKNTAPELSDAERDICAKQIEQTSRKMTDNTVADVLKAAIQLLKN